MKKVLLISITLYQKIISPLLHQALGVRSACRYTPTCTIYAKEAIDKYGAGKGLFLSIRRVINCQPLFKI